MAELLGGKWGQSNALGTSGGVVTWSIAPGGLDITGFNELGLGKLVSGTQSLALASFLNFDFETLLSVAFSAWSSVSDIEFVQVADNGGSASVGLDADIRIFGAALETFDGIGIGPANAPFHYSAPPIFGSIGIDSAAAFNGNTQYFLNLAIHEIGHAIGFGHETSVASIMNPMLPAGVNGLQPADEAGGVLLYGAPTIGPKTYTMRAGQADLELLDAPANLEIVGNALANRISGTDAAEKLTGQGGGDTLIGNGGDDELEGGEGVDSLLGGDGDDILNGGPGADFLLGGVGNDNYAVDDTLDVVDEGAVFPGVGGSAFDIDVIGTTAAWFWDLYSVGERMVIAEGATDSGPGEAGATTVGSVFANEMIGNSGANILFGRGGADTYRAGDGVDFISLSLLGLTEENAYSGVDGANTIVVERRNSGPVSYDIVFEFESGKDRLDVSDYAAENGLGSGADVLARGVDDGVGNAYFILGDGFDYLYMVGLELADLSAGDFIV